MSQFLNHFHLNCDPFNNVYREKLYVATPQQEMIRKRLNFVLENSRGLALVIGPVGTGKTTVVKKFVGDLSKKDYSTSFISLSKEEANDANFILRKIARSFGVRPGDDSEVFEQLNSRLMQLKAIGRQPVLALDEAQLMENEKCLENLKALFNLEYKNEKCLIILLSGLENMEINLRKEPALYQRIAMRCRIQEAEKKTVEQYIFHRLKNSGGSPFIFTPYSLDKIAEYSQGIFRLINVLCDNALLQCYFSGRKSVTGNVIEEIAWELNLKEIELSEEDLLPIEEVENFEDDYGYVSQVGVA